MGQRIGVLREGRIVQIGTPRDTRIRSRATNSSPRWSAIPPINLVAATLQDAAGRRTLELPFVDVDAAPWTASLRRVCRRARSSQSACARRRSSPSAGRGPRRPGRDSRRSVFLTEPLGDVTILDIVAGRQPAPEDGPAAGARLRHRQRRVDRLHAEKRRSLPIRPGDRYGHSSRRGERGELKRRRALSTGSVLEGERCNRGGNSDGIA